MKGALSIIAVSALLAPAMAAAQASAPAPAMPSEHRLSPAEIEKVLADAAARRKAAEQGAVADLGADKPKPQVFGEFGVSVGTGGYREVFGTAIYPMEDGVAAISLDFVDLGNRRYRR